MPRWLWLALGGAVAVGLATSLSRVVAPTASATTWPSFLTNRRAGTKTTESDDGWVFVRPADLAASAGVDVETYTLARITGSEWSDANPVEKAAIAWVIVNVARRRGWSILKMATFTSKYGDQGYYGSQEHGRFASTARDPTDRDIAVADGVLSGQIADPTQGADKFFDPRDQDALHAKRPETYDSAAEIIARWSAEGPRELIQVAGVDQTRLALLRPVA